MDSWVATPPHVRLWEEINAFGSLNSQAARMDAVIRIEVAIREIVESQPAAANRRAKERETVRAAVEEWNAL